jgi:hypothetical protein
MELLSRRARTGMGWSVTGGILTICVGAMAFDQESVYTGRLSAAHRSAAFVKQARGIGASDACGACHADGQAPDRMCARCHTEQKPIEAHRGVTKPAKPPGRQGAREAWMGHPHLPLACASCHREHGERGEPLKRVADATCESCHPGHHEKTGSRTVRKSVLARQGEAAVKAFPGTVLETWSRRCVTCHHEHSDYAADEGEVKK